MKYQIGGNGVEIIMKEIRKQTIMLIAGLMFVISLSSQTIAERPEGLGTQESPFLIGTLSNLRWLSETEEFWSINNSNVTFRFFEQTADIDASETVEWNDGKGFIPIGLEFLGDPSMPPGEVYTYRYFRGRYNGNNYRISNLHITYDANDYHVRDQQIGLFGYVSRSEIINTHLDNLEYVTIHHISQPTQLVIGALIGYSSGPSYIFNCSANGSITLGSSNDEQYSRLYIGGLAGGMLLGSLNNCYSNVYIVDNIAVENNNSNKVGGLVGWLNVANINNSYFYGNITKTSLLGLEYGETYENYGGGFVGEDQRATIKNSYVASHNEFVNVKGLIGTLSTQYLVSNTFWDMTSTGADRAVGRGPLLPNTGLSTEQMKTESTYTNAGWNFDEIWGISPEINDGYPYLRNIPLNPPTEIAITRVNNNITLSWQPPLGGNSGELVGYNVYRSYMEPTSISPTEQVFTEQIGANSTALYSVSAVYSNGESQLMTVISPPQDLSDIDVSPVPMKNLLIGNYPNPFNPSTTISFDVAREGYVSIDIYNIRGQRVKRVMSGVRGAGSHKVVWNGDDASGRSVGSGVYFYRMSAEGYSSVKKMLLMK